MEEPAEIDVKDTRLYGLVALYDMQTQFFKSAIDGISKFDSQNRLNTKANHMAWLVGSLVQQRYDIAKMFGTQMQQAADELFKNNQGIQDNVDYPALSDFLADWGRISPITRDILIGLTPEKSDAVFDMGGMKMTHFEFLSFVTYREANCIGQLALWRRLLGYPAIKYD